MQYNDELLKWVVSVAFPPSAAGARDPIESIVSTVSHNVGESSVELFRYRMYLYLRVNGIGIYRDVAIFPSYKNAMA